MGEVISLHDWNPYRSLADKELVESLYLAGKNGDRKVEHVMLVELHYRKVFGLYTYGAWRRTGSEKDGLVISVHGRSPYRGLSFPRLANLYFAQGGRAKAPHLLVVEFHYRVVVEYPASLMPQPPSPDAS